VLSDYLLGVIQANLTSAGEEGPSNDELRDMRHALVRSHDFKVAMERIWPVLTPEQLLNDLFGTPVLLHHAAPELDEAEIAALYRERHENAVGVSWTMEDVPLLDEAAEQLGPADDAQRRREERLRRAERREEAAYAQQVLGTFQIDSHIDADMLAESYSGARPEDFVEIAKHDRTVKFGHVIVDEAQELSPMTWRMIFRRNPSRSMTIVGDLAQASSPWSPRSWDEVLDPYGADRWRQVELTVNYRTPREIMELAGPVLGLAHPGTVAPSAIRDSGIRPVAYHSTTEELTRQTATVVRSAIEKLEEGRLCVLAPTAALEELRATFARDLPLWFAGGVRTDDARIVLLDARDAKGLEFDVVVLVEPSAMVAESPRGMSDLYVALTRATQHLVIVYSSDLPSVFPQAAIEFAPLEEGTRRVPGSERRGES
jgi:hypothetical protein